MVHIFLESMYKRITVSQALLLVHGSGPGLLGFRSSRLGTQRTEGL